MEVILLKDIAKVGRKHEIVTVSEGYAINFLIPRGMAKAATPAARRDLESQKAQHTQGTQAEQAKIAQGIATVDGKTITMHRKANDEGHLFAALHADAISSAVYDQLGVCLRNELFPDHIKSLGSYPIELASAGKKGTLTLVVERES